MRKNKFRAWIPGLEVMLYNVTVYPDGMIGVSSNTLTECLPEKYRLYDDGIYHVEENVFELKQSVLTGDEWLWFESGESVVMQYIGLKDCGKKEIYEKDIGVRFLGEKMGEFNDYWLIEWLSKTAGFTTTCIGELRDGKYIKLTPKQNSYSTRFSEIEIIGNIHQHGSVITEK